MNGCLEMLLGWTQVTERLEKSALLNNILLSQQKPNRFGKLSDDLAYIIKHPGKLETKGVTHVAREE